MHWSMKETGVERPSAEDWLTRVQPELRDHSVITQPCRSEFWRAFVFVLPFLLFFFFPPVMAKIWCSVSHIQGRYLTVEIHPWPLRKKMFCSGDCELLPLALHSDIITGRAHGTIQHARDRIQGQPQGKCPTHYTIPPPFKILTCLVWPLVQSHAECNSVALPFVIHNKICDPWCMTTNCVWTPQESVRAPVTTAECASTTKYVRTTTKGTHPCVMQAARGETF